MAAITFYGGGNNYAINNLNGSGIGFFGGAFGNSIAVGAWNQGSYITDSTGTSMGPQINNIQYVSSQSGVVNGAISGINLLAISNNLATLWVSFTNSTNVKTSNSQLVIYDRSSILNPASGVSVAVAQLIHPDPIANNNGSGNNVWQFPTGSSVILNCTNSPGVSGLSPNGTNTSSTEHDYYFAISGSPSSIGSKLFALYFQLLYL